MHGGPGVHWHEPSGINKAGYGEFRKQPTPYDAFMESEEVPVFRGIGISKVQDLPLVPWKRMGGKGHYIQLYGTETKWGCYVVEVPAAGALHPEKHMYEEIFLVVEGRGSTEVWLEGDTQKHVFEWQKGSMFSIPMNAWHQIVNATSSGALLLAGNDGAERASTRSRTARQCSTILSCSATGFPAPTTSTGPRTISSPIRYGGSPCGEPTSFLTRSIASCRSTTGGRSAGGASNRS